MSHSSARRRWPRRDILYTCAPPSTNREVDSIYSTVGPRGPEDLARYALIIKPQSGGQVTHEWVPLKDFELAKLRLAKRPLGINRDLVRVSTADSELEEYCEGRRIQCEQDCLTSSRPVLVDAGVAFTVVVVGSGGGALALAPLVVFVEDTSGLLHEALLAEVRR